MSNFETTSQRPSRFERDVSEVGKENLKEIPKLEYEEVDISREREQNQAAIKKGNTLLDRFVNDRNKRLAKYSKSNSPDP